MVQDNQQEIEPLADKTSQLDNEHVGQANQQEIERLKAAVKIAQLDNERVIQTKKQEVERLKVDNELVVQSNHQSTTNRTFESR